MAIGPKISANREKEFCEIERIIDDAIESKLDESNVIIFTYELPSIHYHLDRLKDLYLQVGWKDVKIKRANDFQHEVLELVR